VKKIRDDVLVVQPPFGPIDPGPLRHGLSPFLLATGHHAAIAGGQGAPASSTDATVAAYAAALADASGAVSEARRNVVALQTALTGATSELARAQEDYDAVVAAVQST
jgi:hypothetical protein